ncbi:hypothetical protein Pla52o_44550 [Novipirellula galeiformis]|uniref:Uncharacterized protein n=1 Tax=Novipirellula galeiformis TaxID=2528004 RepID=A0A5C6C9F3_9BACT|nr:hypothetical protein Pla52o_44550 [Novipirellula galeiformis]
MLGEASAASCVTCDRVAICSVTSPVEASEGEREDQVGRFGFELDGWGSSLECLNLLLVTDRGPRTMQEGVFIAG